MKNFLAWIPYDLIKVIMSWLLPSESPPRLSNAVTTDWLQSEFMDISNISDALMTQDTKLRSYYDSWLEILSLNADCHISVSLRDGFHQIRNSWGKTNKNTHTASIGISVQFNNNNANHKHWKGDFIRKATHILDTCDKVDSLMFDECSSDVESIIDEVELKTLSRLKHIGIDP